MSRKKFTTYIEEESIAWLKQEALKQEIATGSKVTAADIINGLIEKERKRMEKKYIVVKQEEGHGEIIARGTESEIVSLWNRDPEYFLLEDDDDTKKAALDAEVSTIKDLQDLKLDWSWYRILFREEPDLGSHSLAGSYEATDDDFPTHSDLEFRLDGVDYFIKNVAPPEGWDGESDWTEDDEYIDRVAKEAVKYDEYEAG